MISVKEKKRLSKLSQLIYKASKTVKILRHLAWPLDVKNNFFKENCQKLPIYTYPIHDDSELKFILNEADKYFGHTLYDSWLKIKAEEIKKNSSLLKACGTKEFFNISSDIYGLPTTPIHDNITKPVNLSNQFEKIIGGIKHSKLKLKPSPSLSSSEVAKKIDDKVKLYFNEYAPQVQLVKNLSARATATSKYIRIREGSEFDQADINQLLNHEAYIHVATTINGRKQKNMKILGANYGSVTKTQEGLAVFSEFISGSIDVDRLKRISDRTIAIQMAIEGADFIDVYNYFIKEGVSRDQAFENSRRVFRGGVLSGGAPFTKDLVYLDGFIRVFNFLRSAISLGKIECIELLFSGKMDLDDMPIIYSLYKDGLIRKPDFIPPWANNLNYLICFFSVSMFIEDIDYSNVSKHYDLLLDSIN